MAAKRRRTASGKQIRDKVLQARIPADLDEELRNRAGRLGLSVSTVVRNVLLNTFNLVETVVTDSVQIAQVLNRQSPQSSDLRSETAPVVGWQALTLELNAVCSKCNEILPRGTSAGVGLPIGNPAVFLCKACLKKVGVGTTRRGTAKSTGG